MTASQRTLPPPLPPDVAEPTDPPPQPSSATPRTIAAKKWALQVAALVKRYGAAVIAFGGALGFGAAEVARGGLAFGHWVQDQGPWVVVALVALGLWAIHVVHTRAALREALTALERRGDKQVDVLEKQLERQAATFQHAIEQLVTSHGNLAAEVAALKARGEPTEPRARVTLEGLDAALGRGRGEMDGG